MPGSLDLGTFSGSGPNGALLLGRLMDMGLVCKRNLIYLLHYFDRHLARAIGFKGMKYGPLDLMN